MWWLWVILIVLLAIPFTAAGVLLATPGSILRPNARSKKPNPPNFVYQLPMTRRHTDKRKADTRLELADWEVSFTTLELELALNGFAPSDGTYVSSSVLTWCYEHDRARFDIFMNHNNRLDMANLGYSGAQTVKRISDVKVKGEYDAKRHSDYY